MRALPSPLPRLTLQIPECAASPTFPDGWRLSRNAALSFAASLPETSVVPDKSDFTAENIVISVLGGIAAALIFAVVTRGGAGGLMLAHLAPLPIMIIALGYGVRHGASAALLATAILSVYPHPVVGMVYSLMVAGPAWLACYAASGAPRGRRDFVTANYPGWAALAPAAIIALVVCLWLIVATLSFGSLDDALNPIRARAYIVLDEMIKDNKSLEGKFDPVALSGSVAMVVPAFIACYTVGIHIVNLWIAGRLTLASGLLTRPWPDIAEGFRLPKAVGAVFLSGLALCLFNGPSAAIGYVITATMGLILSFQGLAVAHARLRDKRNGMILLAGMYFLVGVLGWPLVLFTLVGLIDLLADFRNRKATVIPGPDRNSAPKSD